MLLVVKSKLLTNRKVGRHLVLEKYVSLINYKWAYQGMSNGQIFVWKVKDFNLHFLLHIYIYVDTYSESVCLASNLPNINKTLVCSWPKWKVSKIITTNIVSKSAFWWCNRTCVLYGYICMYVAIINMCRMQILSK